MANALAKGIAVLKAIANVRMVNAEQSAIVNEIWKKRGRVISPSLTRYLEKSPVICYIYYVN
ncbi:MAG: hypothetical protein PHP10_06380 [Candidatus Omnitrophica bacterium]|nr:hypothetical protein [Candidatus Omnitrophota bacterium]